jgi:hypothetical protein
MAGDGGQARDAAHEVEIQECTAIRGKVVNLYAEGVRESQNWIASNRIHRQRVPSAEAGIQPQGGHGEPVGGRLAGPSE